ncbi:hypothetical protein [Dyella tabacisoli]|uniref:hypothetical protein n=1 Tax=Dyella tabacisoli TaxID=2282381 RepID=UPI0013B4454B|nr:hypothetical protein [Dyella tabacisoli]
MKNVLLFSGQGSHHFQMGLELFDCDAGFREAMRHADGVVRARCGETPNIRRISGKVLHALQEDYVWSAVRDAPMRTAIKFSFAAPNVPLIANATARPYDEQCMAETLAMQITPASLVTEQAFLEEHITGQALA